MIKYFIFSLLISLQLVLNYDEKDFYIDEVKREINLKESIITIQNSIKLKKNSYQDTFRYLVPKNNTFSLVRITAETNQKKKLEMQKVSDDQDYDYYDILLQGFKELIVKEDYFEKLQFKPKNIYILEDQLELFVDTITIKL